MQPDPFLKMKSLQRYNYLPAHVRPDPQLCCGVNARVHMSSRQRDACNTCFPFPHLAAEGQKEGN